MKHPRAGAGRRTLILLLALAPAIAALATVAVRYGGQLIDNEGGAIGMSALGFGTLYLVACVIALNRGAPMSKVALAGWSATITFGLVYGARGTWKAISGDDRVHADSLQGKDRVASGTG